MSASEAYLNLSASESKPRRVKIREETDMKMYYTTCVLVALAISVQSGPIPRQDEQGDAFAEVMYPYFTFRNIYKMYLQH